MLDHLGATSQQNRKKKISQSSLATLRAGRARLTGRALDAMTDKQIEASIANDPDWSDSRMSTGRRPILVIPPKKKAISIRVDEDVLDYFKKEGAGYQRRINAVLRSYMQQKRKKRA